MLNCKLKVISPYNYGSSKVEIHIITISDIIVKHLGDKGQMWPLFATRAAYAMNTFAFEALNGFSPFQLVFAHDPPDLTSLIPQNRYHSCHAQRILQFIISQSSNCW